MGDLSFLLFKLFAFRRSSEGSQMTAEPCDDCGVRFGMAGYLDERNHPQITQIDTDF